MDPGVDLALRVRCIRSIENLFRELFAARCVDNVLIDTRPLHHSCGMLWDWVVREAVSVDMNPDGNYRTVRDPEIDRAILDTLVRILAMPNVASQRSALHGRPFGS